MWKHRIPSRASKKSAFKIIFIMFLKTETCKAAKLLSILVVLEQKSFQRKTVTDIAFLLYMKFNVQLKLISAN